jgi:hypothetical protein
MSFRVPTFASLLALVACSSQADPSYPGQPLATLRGEAIAVDTTSFPPLDVALDWYVSATMGADGGLTMLDNGGWTNTPVSGQFPSAFTLQVFTPPPESALIPCLGSDPSHPAAGHYAVGLLTALASGEQGSGPDDIFGFASEYALIYADSNLSICKGDLNEYANPAQLSRGYHLYRRVVGPCTPTNSGGCSFFAEVPLSTAIDLPIRSPASFQHPRFLGISASSQNCLGAVSLPTDATGSLLCPLVFTRFAANGMPDWGPCDGPGEAPADDQTVADVTFVSVTQPTAFCELVQLPSDAWVNGSCAQSTESGWCFPPSTPSCASPLELSAATPSLNPAGASNFEAMLVCP